MLDANEIVWTPQLEPFDEDEPPIREIDHTGDDPGPQTISTGEIRPLEAVDGVSGQEPTGEPGEVREVPAGPEGSGPRDRSAPVAGGALHPGGIDGMRLFEQLDEKGKAQYAERWQTSQPEYVRAARIRRRERIRLGITIAIFLAILIEAGVAVYIAAIAKLSSWDHVKDWLAIALVPFVAAATVASSFWFPSREAD